jgi:hypothetical protein
MEVGPPRESDESFDARIRAESLEVFIEPPTEALLEAERPPQLSDSQQQQRVEMTDDDWRFAAENILHGISVGHLNARFAELITMHEYQQQSASGRAILVLLHVYPSHVRLASTGSNSIANLRQYLEAHLEEHQVIDMQAVADQYGPQYYV